MHFRNLCQVSCLIALCFFFAPAAAQNTSTQTADTAKKSSDHASQPKDSIVVISDPIVVIKRQGEPFNQGAIFNPLDQLSGKIAGVTVTHPGGDPNQAASVSIRGQSSVFGNLSPLFVVDGVILDDAVEFQNIPPEDIASYTILKDASAAAFYGGRAANGVIIVTTKKGKAGHPVISYSGLVGSSVQSKYYDLLTPAEFRAAVGNTNGGFTDKGASTDWQKAINRRAWQQRNSLSVSGGSDNFNYLGGVDYQDQQGIILNSGKKELGLRFSGELKTLADKLDIKAGVQNVNTNRQFDDYGAFSYVFNAPPTFPVKNADGSYYTFSDFNLANPAEHLNEEDLGGKEHLTLLHASVDYSIIHDLKIGIFGSANLNRTQSDGYIPSFPLEGNQSESSHSDEHAHLYNGNIHLDYSKTFGKHTLDLLAGYEYNSRSDSLNYSYGPANAITTGALGTKYKLTSFFARAAYNYDDIFYATASLRRDGSSTLEPDQHSYFPAISLAYSFKNILASAGWISDMKLKAGYGVTGNNTDQYGNPVLQWEQVRGRNIGLDFSLFSGRLSGDMEYFNNQTRDLLLLGVLPSPPFVPGTALTNGGSLTNKGFELSLSARVISGEKLSWTAYGQITFINTKVTDLSSRYTYNGQTYNLNTSQLPDGYAEGRGLSLNPIMFIKTGYSPYVFYLPHFTGVDAQGNQTFDGKTIQQNPNPQGYYIDAAPKFNYGITNSFDYGNWNLNVALRGVYGQKVFDNTLLNVETITRLPYNNVTKEALTNGIKDAPVASDKWLENASYLRLDNIQLSYSFKNVSFASVLRVFVAANNLFVITAYKGLDPEVKTSNSPANNNFFFGRNITGSQNQPYIDNNYNEQAYYPMARTFSLGVNVSLK